jgi:hypothetical protein
VAIAGKWCQGEREQPTGCRSVLPWTVVVVSGCWQCSITGSSVGPLSSRSVKPATKRQRRQRRAGPGGDRRQVVPGRTRDSAPAADRGCRGLWSWCRGAGNPRLPLAWPVLEALDHRQFGRFFVLSIGEAGYEATTAPASSGAGWRSAGKWCQGDGETAHRRPIGVAVAWSGSRAAGKSGLPPAWSVLAVLNRRQFGRVFVFSICEASHEATTAPVSGSAWWRSPASGPGRRRDGALTADRGCRGVVKVPGCWQALVAGVRQGCRWRGPCCGGARSPANWRCCAQGVQLVGQFCRVFVLSIGEAGHEATTAPVSGGTWKAITNKRARAKARQRTDGRLGLPWRGQDLGRFSIACKRARATTRRRTDGRSGVPWRGQGAGLLAGIGCRRVPGLPLAWPVLWRCSITGKLALLWSGACSSSGSSAGSSSSRSVQPATRRRRRQCRAVPGGDRRQMAPRRTRAAHRLPIGVAVAWSGSRGAGNPRLPPAWSVLVVLDHRRFFRAFVLSIGKAGHEATTAPGSSGAWWRAPASGPGRRWDSATAADRACRGVVRVSGCWQASVTDACQGCRRRGPCWRCSITGS